MHDISSYIPAHKPISLQVVDGVPYIYPAWLYQPEGSPLHVLQKIRDYDINTYNDPLFQEHLAPDFMHFLFVIEIGFQLPTVLYSLYRFRKGTTTGPFELLLLVYAFETAFSTVLCMNSVFFIDEQVFTPEQRTVFLWQLMGPWVAVRKATEASTRQNLWICSDQGRNTDPIPCSNPDVH